MPKVKISEYSATANSNTDVASINIDEGCAPSGINNAIRAIMGHLKDFQSGTSNDPFTVGSSGSLTLSYGTANGVAYLNGSKVLTTGSALVFDGTNLGIGTTSPSDTIGYGRALDIQSTTGAAIYLRDSDNPTTQYAAIAFDGNASVNNLNIINSSSTGPIRLFTNGAERARIDSSGNLIVAGTASGLTNNNSQQITANGYLISNHVNGTSSGSVYVYFGYNGSSIGSITQNGTTGVLYNLTSDYRLKNDQQALTGAKDFIMALKPKKWQWWDGSGEGVGFVAHEFMEVAKHSGNGEKDAVDADGKPVYQSIQPSSSEVMANLVAFIQEQQVLITQLTARITALESA